MAHVIVYYSLTGRTRKVCEALAVRLDATLVQIDARLVNPGGWSVLRWGYGALFGGRTPITAPKVTFDPGDTLILGAQIWAGRVSVPMRCWLETAPPLPDKVGLVLTSGDARFPDAGFARFAKAVGTPPTARLHVSQADADADQFAPQIATFCDALGG